MTGQQTTREQRLADALATIGDAHIPDQPASSGLTRSEWAVEHIKHLRRIAREALKNA